MYLEATSASTGEQDPNALIVVPKSEAEKELDTAAEVVDWGTRTFTSYVGA